MPSYLITGASRGLGYGFLQVLSSNPANTIIGLVRDIPTTKIKLANDKIANVHLVSADITNPAALKEAAGQVNDILASKGLDVLINNAAYMSESTVLNTLANFENDSSALRSEIDKSLSTNLHGVLSTVYAFLPHIRKGSLKKVLAISSGQADIDFINETNLPFTVPYAISKSALSILFAKLNAAYASTEGIMFMSVCPGMVDTDGLHALDASDLAVERAPVIMEALGRYTGGEVQAMTPVESAESVLRLLERSDIEGGHGGSFRSHNGTKRYL